MVFGKAKKIPYRPIIKNNIQNNQRKDNLNQIYKCFMFTKVGNIKNLKKSGDLISTTNNDIIIKTVVNNHSELNSRNLDLANNIVNLQEQYIIEQTSISTTTIAIKNIKTGMISPIQVNRHLATYGRVDKNNMVELDNVKIPFIKYKAKAIEAAESALKQKIITNDQFLVYVKRMDALNLSFVHATIADILKYDIIKDNEEYYTIGYHVITTKPTLVDYGGPNTFKPLFLYNEKETNITYYTIPLTYVYTLKKKDFYTLFLEKNRKVFKNDTLDVQNSLAHSINKVSEINNFKMLNVNEKCLNINFSDIIPDEVFPDSIYSKDITCFVPGIPNLID
jgi:hypothetical protein